MADSGKKHLPKSIAYPILGVGIALACIVAILQIPPRKPPLATDAILSVHDEQTEYGELTIVYPLDETLFPPEIAAPTFRWRDGNFRSDAWVVSVRFQDSEEGLRVLRRIPEWTPADEEWEKIRRRSLDKDAQVTIIGVSQAAPNEILSSARITIRTSEDEVAAPIFYREVNLPFIDAVKDPSRIRWRFGDISSKAQPPIILEGLPVCGNCHSFSADGAVLGMDVDYANDKGSYAIVRIEQDITLSKDKVITWSDYKRDDKEATFGLLSQVSPDGRYVVSTVKDRSVFVPKPDLRFSQLFFPLKGILSVYDRENGTFRSLPGADDKKYVQSNATWSPDGRHIIFARSEAYPLKKAIGDRVLLTRAECSEFLDEGKEFLFDLYRIPFNDGQGGRAEPLPGASGNGMSNYFAKYSPDGKWIVFCKAKSFMLLQPDSELYIMPAEGGEPRRMRCNTPVMNSWHSWSPNGKWLVFSSKANGAYTQLYLTHIDAQGNDTPAVLLDRFTAPDRAANIPEFVNVKPGAIKRIREQFIDDLSFVRAGKTLLDSNDPERAEQTLRHALQLNPENVEALTALGRVLALRGSIAEALVHLTEAIRLDPNHVLAHNNLGIALAQQGQIDKAVEHLTAAIRLDPTRAKPHNNLGIVLAQQGKLDEAVEHFTAAVELDPDRAESRNNLGQALALQGKLQEAVVHLTEAIRLDPEYAPAHNNLGSVLEKQGKLDEAIARFSRALELSPGHPQVRTALQRALQKKKSLARSRE